MLEKDFQKQVIEFLKQHNIYYIKIWRWRLSTFRNTGPNNMFKRQIYGNRTKNRYTERHQHCSCTT